MKGRPIDLHTSLASSVEQSFIITISKFLILVSFMARYRFIMFIASLYAGIRGYRSVKNLSTMIYLGLAERRKNG